MPATLESLDDICMQITCLTFSLQRGPRRFARLSYRTFPANPYILSTAVTVVSTERQRAGTMSLQLHSVVVSSTTAKFKPLTYLVMGFSVSNVANIFILIILHDVCFLPKNYDQPELYRAEILNFIFFRSLKYSEQVQTVPVCKRMV